MQMVMDGQDYLLLRNAIGKCCPTRIYQYEPHVIPLILLYVPRRKGWPYSYQFKALKSDKEDALPLLF